MTILHPRSAPNRQQDSSLAILSILYANRKQQIRDKRLPITPNPFRHGTRISIPPTLKRESRLVIAGIWISLDSR